MTDLYNKIQKQDNSNIYKDAKGTGVISSVIFMIIVFVLMFILSFIY